MKFRTPKQYCVDGIVFPGALAKKETLELIQQARVPHFDVLLATYPRTGKLYPLMIIINIILLSMNENHSNSPKCTL